MDTSLLAASPAGIVTPLLTPLSNLDKLDPRGLERLLHHVIEGGVAGIFLLGTSGEGPSLSYALRLELIRRSCEQVARRIPVLVGISDTALTESLHLAEEAAKAGASGLVVAPPYYLRYSQSDLLYYLEQLSADLPLPLLLYNFPDLTKIPFSPATVQRASEMPGIIGLKDSSGDMEYLNEVLRVVPRNFGIFVGPERHLLEALRAGARGGVCGGSNVNPQLFAALYNAAANGDWATAEQLQAQVDRMADLLYGIGDPETGYLRGIKCAASFLDLCEGVLAAPLRAFTENESSNIETALRVLKLIK